MRKGEIARYEQFLLFPQCFQKAYFQGASKGVVSLCGNGLTLTLHVDPLLVTTFDTPMEKRFENIVGKGEKAGNNLFCSRSIYIVIKLTCLGQIACLIYQTPILLPNTFP